MCTETAAVKHREMQYYILYVLIMKVWFHIVMLTHWYI